MRTLFFLTMRAARWGKPRDLRGDRRPGVRELSESCRVSQRYAAGAEGSSPSGRDTLQGVVEKSLQCGLRTPFVLKENNVQNRECKYIPT
jgi:hypothetical protein